MADESRVGRAGQLAVMSELLLHGYNVAVPEVDVGDDVWVVRDDTSRMWRVQVKTATGKQTGYGYSGGFAIPLKQLTTPTVPPLIYVLALRETVGRWQFVVIPQEQLRQEREEHSVGALQGHTVRLYLAFRESEVNCSGRDWQRYRNLLELPDYP
ncbi:MAG: hypothetical protein L0Z62_03810 [Gemmataceae bacterium]|nr:hypothetical protein [Gemmataceae bacterium]